MIKIPFLFLMMFSSTAALAQRTGDNVVTAAGDAFGKAVGNERIGLYSIEDVRGFNPIDAGNARIEGLYFAQQDRLASRLIEGSTIRVGITAQGYPFPAPTGIVDYRLILPESKASASLEIERGPYGGVAGSLETKFPIFGERLGFAAGVGRRRQIRTEGGINNFRAYAVSAAWRPYSGAEIIPFWSGFTNRNDEARVTIFPAGGFLPPKIKRGQFLGQTWTDRNTSSRAYGLIVKLPFGAWRAEMGLFEAEKETSSIFADLLLGVTAGGQAARRIIIADGNNHDNALSGEVRLARTWTSGNTRHNLTASLRGRDQARLFGGQQQFNLGASSSLLPDFRPQPVITLGPDDSDKVRQLTYGLAYGLQWARRGSLDLSVSKSRYRKTVDFADPRLPTLLTKDDPFLFSATASVTVTSKFALYGGFVRGLEEAIIAPDIAVNRAEAPAAIRTRQIDGGFRFSLTPKLTLVAGAFSVKKPYYNIDAGLRFRQLGIVDNRGIEISLAGSLAKGLSVVAGTVFLDPTISGEDVATGRIGSRPIGSLARRSIANFDWRPEGVGPWSFDLAVESQSARTANADNSFSVPARENLSLGTRYRFKIEQVPVLIRIQMTNVLNTYGWQVSSSGGYQYSFARTFTLQLVADL